MKRFLAIPLFLLYFTAVSGVIIQVHFCGEKIESFQINTSANDCCCAQNTSSNHPPKTSNCCANKTIVVKAVQDQIPAPAFNFLFGDGAASLLPSALTGWHLQAPIVIADNHGSFQANAPPGVWQNFPLYKLHQRFTLYG